MMSNVQDQFVQSCINNSKMYRGFIIGTIQFNGRKNELSMLFDKNYNILMSYQGQSAEKEIILYADSLVRKNETLCS